MFESFFERVVWQCVEGGLVDGKKLFCDSSLIEPDASRNSVVNTQGLRYYLNPAYREREARLEEREEKKRKDRKNCPPKERSISASILWSHPLLTGHASV